MALVDNYRYETLARYAGFRLQSQILQYPVQVFTQVTQSTPYVPEYYSGTMPKLRVMVNNLDFQTSTLQVYLRIKIESFMFSLTTPAEVYAPRYTLDAGMPLQLSGEDLAVYFRQENIRVSGNRSEFLRTQQFPDGTYSFHFEVYDAATHRLLSSPTIGRAVARIMLGEPPVPQFPEKAKIISETPFPNIMFNWRPALNLPAGYNVEYEFSMAEIYDKNVNPEAAFTYSRILYTERTPAPSFIHGLSQPMLIPGMRYAWRVRAIAKQGIEETSVIKNDGFSQVFWFDYTADCKIVTTLGAIYENNKVNITWQDVNAMNYTVEYRKKNSSKWYTGDITQPELCTVYNLKNGIEYEYRVGSRCVINDAYQYSDIKGIKIPSKEDLQQERQRNCGIMPDTKITNKTPIEQLIPGQPVLAGDFPVFISKVSGSGRFSGEGYVGIPYIGNLKVAVTFKDIVVNTDNRLISGYFETKYDAVNNMTVDIDQTLTGGKGVGDVRTGEEKAAYTVDYNINPDIKVLPVKADGTKDEIAESGNYTLTKGENDKYVFIITDSEGKEHQMETDTVPTTIEDKSGNTFTINENGSITPLSIKTEITLDPNTKNTPRPDIATLTFEATPNTKYAVDSYKEVYAKVTEYFLKYKPTTEDMIASAKFMIPGASDEIFVKVTDSKSKFNPEKVHFITDKGKEYHGVYNTDKKGWTLTVLGSEANDGQNLYVVQEEATGKYATLAKLNIYSYEPKRLKVKLVPVNGFTNGFTKETVSQQLNAIYNKVGISCEVEMAPVGFNYTPVNDNSFDVTGSGLFSKLTTDMRKIRDAYQQANPEETADCYLFIIENVTGNENVAGDMPRDEKYGYLFSGSTSQTIGHEIGHGAFHLDHPFDRANAAKSFADTDLADNLMQYKGGTNLVKLQWDAIHAPGLVIGVFETDKDAMVYSKNQISTIFNRIRDNNRKKTPPLLTTDSIVRAIDIYQDKFIEDYADDVSMTKENFLATITHEQAETLGSRDTTSTAWDKNPIVLANKAHIKLKLDNKKDSVEFVVSINGYSITKQIFTTWITTEENNNRMVFYNATYAKKQDKITEQDVKSNRKAFDITVHQSAGLGTFEELKTYLKIKGYIDFSDTPGNKVVLELNRKKSNEYVTVGELTVRGTDIKFFTLELGRNINNSSTTECSTKNHDQYLCGRIKAGTYKFELNTIGTAQHRYKSLRLEDIPENNRGGILIHRGKAYLWTQGCILLMIANEIDDILENPEPFMYGETQEFNSNVEYQVPVLALYDYIEKYGNSVKIGKKTYMGEIIIADDDNVNISNNNNFTKEINYRREAARLYYDNEKAIQNILRNTTDSLMKAIINDVIYQELCMDGENKLVQPLQKNVEKIDSILQTKNFKDKIKEKAIRNKIISNLTNALMQSNLSSIFAKIQSDKDKVISKFFRTPPTSGPFPPLYYIKQRFCNYDDKNTNSYLKEKITQKNIDDYINQQKNTYKK